MRVLVYTDASIYEKDQKRVFAGGGAVLVPVKGTVVAVKRCMKLRDINAAECRMAYIGSRLGAEYYEDSHHVVTKTDSKTTVKCLKDGRPGEPDDSFQQELDRICGYFGNTGVGFSINWIEGHQSGEEADAIFNRRADKLASESVEWMLRKI